MNDASTWRSRDFLAPGTPITLDNCDREPLHFAGAIQPAGLLLVVDDQGIVEAASINAGAELATGAVLGRSLSGLTGVEFDEIDRVDPPVIELASGPAELVAHINIEGRRVVEACLLPEPSADPDSIAALIDAFDIGHEVATVQSLADQMVARVRDIFGFDRVWMYRFAEDDHGEIIAEATDAESPAFLGLHYPAADIPAQARAMFLESRVRVIQDVAGAPVPLDSGDPQAEPIDLADSVLRAVSPMHVQYLATLGVRASMSIALVVSGRLWGLISCHNYGGPRLLTTNLRRTARALSNVVSLQIEALEAKERAERRVELETHVTAVLTSVAGDDAVIDGLVASGDALLRLTDSTGVLVILGGRQLRVGDVPSDEVTAALLGHLDDGSNDSEPVVVESLSDAVHDISEPMGGALALPLSREARNWVIWFRPEFTSTVTWGHNRPADTVPDTATDVRTLRLSAVGSFSTWSSTVTGRCRPFEPAEIEAAAALRSALGSFVLRRSEQLARTVASLHAANAELDRFAYVAAHDLKEPLRGIFNYTDLLVEEMGPTSGDVSEAISAIHRLSATMAGLVDSLLSYATVGRGALELERFQLEELAEDARHLVQARLDDVGGEVVITANGAIEGDRVQLTQVLTNLIANGLKYNLSDRPTITIGLTSLADTGEGWDRWPQHAVDAAEPVVISVADNGIGIDAELRDEVFEVFRRLHDEDAFGGGTGAGLTIARRIAERHGGRLWVEAGPETGSIFYLALPPQSAGANDGTH